MQNFTLKISLLFRNATSSLEHITNLDFKLRRSFKHYNSKPNKTNLNNVQTTVILYATMSMTRLLFLSLLLLFVFSKEGLVDFEVYDENGEKLDVEGKVYSEHEERNDKVRTYLREYYNDESIDILFNNMNRLYNLNASYEESDPEVSIPFKSIRIVVGMQNTNEEAAAKHNYRQHLLAQKAIHIQEPDEDTLPSSAVLLTGVVRDDDVEVNLAYKVFPRDRKIGDETIFALDLYGLENMWIRSFYDMYEMFA